MTRSISWKRPLIAVGGGACVALITRAFAGSGRATLLARDLAAGIGFPVDTATDISHPWAVALIAMGSAWTIWLCLEIRSLAQQFALFVAALALCLTGSWLAHIGGGAVPTVPVMVALCLAFIAGQFAAGFGGSPRQQALLGLLDGKLNASRSSELATAGNEPVPDESRDCLVTAIEVPASDREFFPVLRQGLLTDGAFLQERDDGLCLVIYGLWDDLDENSAWSSLARAVDGLVARPEGWKLATARGTVRRFLDLGETPSLHLRGRVISDLATLLDEGETTDDAPPHWLSTAAPPAERSIGWQLAPDSAAPLRLNPTESRAPVPPSPPE
ncbi:MAG: hypothetical protein ACKO2G_07205 [Verrucomicrobiales bacterium]